MKSEQDTNLRRVYETDIQIQKHLTQKLKVNSKSENRKLLETTTGKIDSDYNIYLMKAGFLNY